MTASDAVKEALGRPNKPTEAPNRRARRAADCMEEMMETLRFITPDGACGYTAEWSFNDGRWDAAGRVMEFGDRVGSGVAPLPNGGVIDLRPFCVIEAQDSYD